MWRGLNSEALLESFPGLDLAMVDPYLPYDDPALRSGDPAMMASAMIEAKTRTDRFGWRRDFLIMPSGQATMFFDDGMFSFVFIDGDHSYEGAKADIDSWKSKVKSGGILCGDDYRGANGFGVKRAADERFGDRVQVVRDRIWWVQM